MKLERSSLEFLQIYTHIADTRDVLGDKLKVSIKNHKALFSQFSHDAKLLTIVDAPFEDNASYIHLTSPLHSLLKNTDSTHVDIEQGKIKFNNSEYSMEHYDIVTPDEHALLSVLESKPDKVITIVDLDKLKISKSFMGIEGLDCLFISNNYFVTSDMVLTSIVSTSNDLKTPIYLPKAIVFLLGKFADKEIELHFYSRRGNLNDFYVFRLGIVNVLFPVNKYKLPNLLDEDIKKLYDHKHKARVVKSQMEQVLKRMSIVAVNNPNNRIFITFQEDKLLVESRDSNPSKEEVEAVVDKEIKDRQIVLSCSNLSKALSYLEDENVYLHVADQKENNRTLKLEDEKHDKKLIHRLFKDV